MARQFIIFLTAISFLGCDNSNPNTFTYQCANTIPASQMAKYSANSFKDYSKRDLDKLAEITTSVLKSNGDTFEYEVFYNEKTPTSLVVDIFGITDEMQIDKTVCELFKNRELSLPDKTILLFHRYTNDLNDGGVIVGLKKKP